MENRIITWQEAINEIAECLAEVDTDFLLKVYSDVLGKEIEYVDDSFFSVKGSS